jgi:tetratricopeptide (TPR) repeat protein
MMRLTCTILLLGALAAGCGKPPAEESFAKAEAAEVRAVRSVDTVKSSESARTLFHPVIGDFSKVIEDHPGHVLAEVALFRIATIRNNYTHEIPEALDAYRKYVELYPEGNQAPVSMFLIGYLYNNELHNLDSAAAAYRRFLAKYPDHEMALSAQFELNTLGKPPDDLLPKAGK